jgi:hypothetical protein
MSDDGAVSASEMSVNCYQTTRRNIPGDGHLQVVPLPYSLWLLIYYLQNQKDVEHVMVHNFSGYTFQGNDI